MDRIEVSFHASYAPEYGRWFVVGPDGRTLFVSLSQSVAFAWALIEAARRCVACVRVEAPGVECEELLAAAPSDPDSGLDAAQREAQRVAEDAERECERRWREVHDADRLAGDAQAHADALRVLARDAGRELAVFRELLAR